MPLFLVNSRQAKPTRRVRSASLMAQKPHIEAFFSALTAPTEMLVLFPGALLYHRSLILSFFRETVEAAHEQFRKCERRSN